MGECFFDELGFFGPAVEAAYLQESKYAVYPRLLIETKIGDRLFEWERSHPIDPVVTSMFTSIPRLILEDEDGRHYLNVFYELEKSAVLISGAHHLTLEAVRNVVLNKIACDTARYASNDLIAKKLLWMRSSVERAHFRLNENYVRGSATIVLGS